MEQQKEIYYVYFLYILVLWKMKITIKLGYIHFNVIAVDSEVIYRKSLFCSQACFYPLNASKMQECIY